MKSLVFFLEEPSAKEMLTGLLSRFTLPEVTVRYIVFNGKQDLEKQLVKKMRGWQMPDSAFVVLRDQDSGDCHAIKQRLTELCRAAGKKNVLIRIACRELESFYLGDLLAVEKGLNLRSLVSLQNRKKFRQPDNLTNPSQELYRLTDHAYQKVAGSRAIAPHLIIDINRSHSFQILISGIKRLIENV